MVMGLVFAVVLARGSILKAIAIIVLGILLSTVGTDLETGQERMTFGLPFLSDGIDFAVLAMGIFFQAEDGIRVIGVTGVQTCALPISTPAELVAVRRGADEGRCGAGRDRRRTSVQRRRRDAHRGGES